MKEDETSMSESSVKKTVKITDADKYGTNCLRYTHKDGYPFPASPGSCKGCVHSANPDLWDGGCGHPEGFLSRFKA